MPKRINRIRGILRPLLATCSRNNAIHEISSAESKCIIFCRAERPTAGTEPQSLRLPFSAQSWHDVAWKMTKDPECGKSAFNRLKWLEKHEDRQLWRPKKDGYVSAKFPQVAYYNETRFSPLTPMFRDFQAISASSVRSFARQRKQEVEMPRVVGEGIRRFAHNATSPKEGGRLAEGRPSLKPHFASQTEGTREPFDMNRRAANAFNARTWRRRRRGGGSARRWRAGRRPGCARGC